MQVAIEPNVLTEINNALFTISTKRFIRDLSLAAKMEPKKFHHVYEWNQTGNTSKKLFKMARIYSNGSSLKIGADFIKSKTPVPIPPELLQAGRTGKSVVSRSVFADKADVMESGRGISFQARRTLAFLGRSGVVSFIPNGTIVNILNPGGTQVKGSFEKFFHGWFAANTALVIQSSGILSSLQESIVNALNEPNAGSEKAMESAISTLRSYSGNKVVQ